MHYKKIGSVLLVFLALSSYSHAEARPKDPRTRNEIAWCDEIDEDNCDDQSRKPVTVLDEKTGLMVIERDSDREWNQSPEPKLPFGQIIKLESSFDGQSEYAVFDKNWRKAYPNEYGVVTKWTPDYVQGVSYIKTGWLSCLPLWCCYWRRRLAFSARSKSWIIDIYYSWRFWEIHTAEQGD